MLKLPLEQVMGGRMDEFVAPADRAPAGYDAQRRRRTRRVGPDGRRRHGGAALASAISLRAEGPAAVCLVVSGLTERKRHEAEILQLNEDLEKRVVERAMQLAVAN